MINFAGKDAGRRLGLEGKVESPKTGKDTRNNMGTFIHSFIHYLLSIIHPINIYLAPYCVGHRASDEKNPTIILPSWSLSSNGRDNRQEANTYISISSNK